MKSSDPAHGLLQHRKMAGWGTSPAFPWLSGAYDSGVPVELRVAPPMHGPGRPRKRAPMSLWTPGGEVPIERNPGPDPTEPPAPDGGAAGMVGAPSLDDLSPEERQQAEEMVAQMAEVQRQVLSAPASQFVINHVVGLYELGAIHLGQPEPDLAAAQLAIDAMAALLDATEARLGEDAVSLRDALTQMQMVFVQMKAASAD